MSKGGERKKFLGQEGEGRTSLDLEGGQVRQVSKIHPLPAASNKHQSSHPSNSRELKKVGVRLLRNWTLDELHCLQVAKLKSCQVLCEVGRGGSRVASEKHVLMPNLI